MFLLKVVEMASSKRQLEKRIEELDDEVEEQAEQIQLLEHVCCLYFDPTSAFLLLSCS